MNARLLAAAIAAPLWLSAASGPTSGSLVVVGGPVVELWAVDPTRVEDLRASWERFDPEGSRKGP